MTLFLLLLACQPSSSDDTSVGGATDGGATDGAAVDGGSMDGGTQDGGTQDGGTPDGGAADGGTSTTSGLVVNELMADNEGAVVGADGTVGDWIELYNGGTEDLDLSGHGVSDDWTQPFLHSLPEGTVLAAGDWLLLWADDPEEPAQGHLPFRLDADGEAVGVFTPDGDALDWVVFGDQDADTAWARLPDGADSWEEVPIGTPGSSNKRLGAVTEEVLPAGSTWSYWDGADSPGEGWTERDFDDGAWSSGAAPLGYGDPVTTTISYGPDSNDKHLTAWFRTRFTLAEGRGELAGIDLSLRVDDGAAIYIDGIEVVRANLPDGELTADTAAASTVSGTTEETYSTYRLDATTLSEGDVVVAVEVHQASGTSSDLVMDLAVELERIEVLD